MKTALFLSFLLLITLTGSTQTLVVYKPQGTEFKEKSKFYTITVKQNNNSKESYTYESDAGNGPQRELFDQQSKTFHFTIFSFSGEVTVIVRKLNSKASSAVVRPNRLNIGRIKATVIGNNSEVKFKMEKPGKISIEFDDDPVNKDALMIFADSLENDRDIPNVKANNVISINQYLNNPVLSPQINTIFFPPGYSKINYFNIPAQIKKVYLAGGSFVEGYLLANRPKGFPLIINGRGIISESDWSYHFPDTAKVIDDDSKKWYKSIEINGGSGHVIEGITLINATSFNILINADDVLIKNVNINGFDLNNDGITITGNNVNIANSFIRVNDNSIIPYGSELNIRDCVFWQLAGGSIIQLCYYVHSMHNYNIDNCDVLHAEWVQNALNVGFINANNSVNINNKHTGAVIENFSVSNIYFDTDIKRFLDIRRFRTVSDSMKSVNDTSAPWIYKNFKFKNIHLNQSSNERNVLIYLAGFDDSHPLTDFTFESFYINDKKIDVNQSNPFINIRKSIKVSSL